MSNEIWGDSLEGKFIDEFHGIIRHGYYNNDKPTYILCEGKKEREFDVSFLTSEQTKKLMEESLKIGKDLILEKCKDKEIIITKEMIEDVINKNMFLYT